MCFYRTHTSDLTTKVTSAESRGLTNLPQPDVVSEESQKRLTSLKGSIMNQKGSVKLFVKPSFILKLSKEEVVELFKRNSYYRDNCTNLLPVEVFDTIHASNLLDYLCDVLRTLILFGFNITDVEAKRILLINWIEYVDQAYELDRTLVNWLKVPKFRLGLFAAAYKGSDQMPESPFNKLVNVLPLRGAGILEFIKSFKRDNEFVKYMSLIDSIARGVKKGCARPTKQVCDETLPKTFKKFTSKKVEKIFTLHKPIQIGLSDGHIIDTIYSEEVIDSRRMVFEIERSIDEALRTTCMKNIKWNHFPSTSSSVKTTVPKGGQVPEVKACLDANIGSLDSRISMSKESVLLMNRITRVDTGIVGDPETRSVLDDRLSDSKRLEMSGQDNEKLSEVISVTMGSLAGEDIDDEIVESIAESVLRRDGSEEMVLIALSEALKVRGISKGDALENWLLKPIQVILSRELGLHNVFELTRTPITEDHIDRMFQGLKQGVKLCSGDYADATNELVVEFSRVCIRKILERTGLSIRFPNLSRLAERSLCDNLLSYSYKDELGKIHSDRGKQQNAQPMGKVLSFVCLCLINFSVCRLACELDQGKHITLESFIGYINGDDCVFPLSDFNIWVEVGAIVGLDNSVGKTFHSSEFIEMNSLSYVRLPDGRFKETPYVNWGLLKGLVRSCELNVGTKIEAEIEAEVLRKLSTVGAVHHKLMHGLDHLYSQLNELFKVYHKELFHPLVKGISWYAPEWLGGLGLCVDPELENLNLEEREILGIMYANYAALEPKKLSDIPQWEVHNIVHRYMDVIELAIGYNGLEEHVYKDGIFSDGKVVDFKENHQQLYAHLVNIAWRNNPFSEIYSEEIDPKLRIRKIRNVLNLNRRARYEAMSFRLATPHHVHQPLEWYKIWNQKLVSFRPYLFREIEVDDDSIVVSL